MFEIPANYPAFILATIGISVPAWILVVLLRRRAPRPSMFPLFVLGTWAIVMVIVAVLCGLQGLAVGFFGIPTAFLAPLGERILQDQRRYDKENPTIIK